VASRQPAGNIHTIQALGLAVEQIIPVHGRPGTLEDLKSALARRSTRN